MVSRASTPSGSSRPRIALVGLGSISALGSARQRTFLGYAEPRPRFTRREFNGELLPCAPLADDAERELARFLAERPRLRGLDRSVHLAVFAGRRAATEAWGQRIPERLGVVFGSSRGATALLEQRVAQFFETPSALPPSTSPATTLGNVSSWVAQELSPFALAAPELSSTCSTSLSALGVAIAFLRAGMADCFVAGGSEAPLTAFTMAQMRALGVHATSADPVPCRPCASERPERNCMVLGEGAAALALQAVGDGAAPPAGLAWISGIGFAVEPITSKTSIQRDGLGLRLSMQRALEDAGGEAPDVVVTHTPGTEQGDRAELEALRAVFGANPPYATSNKWLIGHTLGASGVLSLEYATAMLAGHAPLAYPYATPLEARPPASVRRVLVNSIGFGGTAASVVVDRWS